MQVQAEEAARVAAREQEHVTHVKLVDAENATRIAAGHSADAQAAHVEAVNTRDQAMDNRANMHGQNYQASLKLVNILSLCLKRARLICKPL